MEDAELFLAEELRVIEEVLEVVEGLVDTLATEVEGGVEGLALLIDVVVDALEAVALLSVLVDGKGFLLCGRETFEGDGQTDAVAFDDGFAAFDLDNLPVGLLSVD